MQDALNYEGWTPKEEQCTWVFRMDVVNVTMFLFSALSSPGLHYIGQVGENSLLRVAFDQISEGQLEFHQLNQHFDTIHIGLGDEKREYTILSGKTEMKAHLMKQFPDDTEAIETFFKIMKVLC